MSLISAGVHGSPLLSLGARPCERCHAEISAQWARSAHRHASLSNPHYAPAALDFAEERGLSGEGSALFCARCHDPALINERGDGLTHFRVDPERPAERDPAQAGVGCLLCHSIHEPPDPRGNGRYQLDLSPWPQRGPAHKARFGAPVLKSAALCGGCHKASLSEAITEDRWHRGQDDLDQWSQSGWAGVDPLRPLSELAAPSTCQGCHMPLVQASLPDKAADERGRVRSHAFLGANATLASYRGDLQHAQDTARFAQGSVRLWALEGPPEEGEGLTLDLIALNVGAGHRIPAGVNDSNEVWLSVTAWDERGRVVASEGLLPELKGPPRLLTRGALSGPLIMSQSPRPPRAHLFRSQVVDERGEPLAMRDVSAHRSALFDSSLHPFEPRLIRVTLPQNATVVQAQVWMRQHEARYVRYACAELKGEERERCLAQPMMSLAAVTWERGAASAWPLQVTDEGLSEGWPLTLLYPLNLSAMGVEQRSHAEARWGALPPAISLSPRGLLVKMATAAGLGKTDEVLSLARALESPPYRLPPEALPARHWLEARAALSAFRTPLAKLPLARLWSLNPQQRAVARSLSAMWGALGEAERSLTFAEALLKLDPESAEGYRLKVLALRRLGAEQAEVDEAERQWLTFRVDDERRDRLRRAWQAREALEGRLPPLLDELPRYDLR